jgi:hypothetical protein
VCARRLSAAGDCFCGWRYDQAMRPRLYFGLFPLFCALFFVLFFPLAFSFAISMTFPVFASPGAL